MDSRRQRPNGIADDEKIEAIIDDETILAVATALVVHDSKDGGRPRKNSTYALVLVHVIAKTVYGGRVRRTFVELATPKRWNELARRVRERYPDHPGCWLNEEPMLRSQYLAFRDRYLATLDGTTALSELLTRSGAALARDLDLLNRQGSLTNPSSTDCLESDGKVVSSATRFRQGDLTASRSTGELRQRRADPDVGTYVEGHSDIPVRGHRFVVTSARGNGWMNRAILGVASAPRGSELDAVIPLIPKLQSLGLSPRVLTFDGAMRGSHIDALWRRYGVIGIGPVIAERSGRAKGSKRSASQAQRIERVLPLGQRTVRDAQRRESAIEIAAVGGALCEVRRSEDGTPIYERLVLQQLKSRGTAPSFRLYGIYQTKTGKIVVGTIPLFQTEQDATRKRNRTEHLRAFPPGSAQFAALYGRRADAESLNRQLEDACWQKRANCYGRLRVFADVLGFALGQNAIARFLARERAGPEVTLAAA